MFDKSSELVWLTEHETDESGNDGSGFLRTLYLYIISGDALLRPKFGMHVRVLSFLTCLSLECIFRGDTKATVCANIFGTFKARFGVFAKRDRKVLVLCHNLKLFFVAETFLNIRNHLNL